MQVINASDNEYMALATAFKEFLFLSFLLFEVRGVDQLERREYPRKAATHDPKKRKDVVGTGIWHPCEKGYDF